jgi:Uma2 family endonuclease
MALQDRIRKLTYEDYTQIPDDGLRHEIIDGEHYVSPAPIPRHQIVSIELASRLYPFVKSRDLGLVLQAPSDVIFSRHDIVQPDLLFISKKQIGILKEKNVQGSPDLVVEILSKGTRRLDESIKLDLYERSGVLEYWMFDPVLKRTRVFRRTGERLLQVGELSAEAGDVLTTPLLPGLEIPLAEVFPG